MIPGSQILLGIMARVTPWRLVPDAWIPLNALKKIRRKKHPFGSRKHPSSKDAGRITHSIIVILERK